MNLPYICFTDSVMFDAWKKDVLSSFFLDIIRLYTGQAKKRPRVWTIMDEEDFKILVDKAAKYDSIHG